MISIPDDTIAALEAIERRVLWLSTYMVHHANVLRPSSDTAKVGGHQASSASAVSLLTALYFKALRPTDVVAIKAHAAPAFYAIQYLRGRLTAADLKTLRAFGGLQAYPSRRKNPGIVDLSTGSMGLGAIAATFGGLASRYLADHFGSGTPKRVIVMVGDAELDEGNVWEALAEEVVGTLGNVLWIVDLNRQSLDRIVPDTRLGQLRTTFAASGWRVAELRYGARLTALFGRPGGVHLRARLDSMPNAEYHRILRLPAAQVRKALALDGALDDVRDDALAEAMADLGGHDLRAILAAFDEADRAREQPSVIFAHTIKGWRLPFAADPLNHTALLTSAQIEALREDLGVAPGDEWAALDPQSAEGRLIATLPRLFTPPAPTERPSVPEALDERYSLESSTQEAFGRVLGALGRSAVAPWIVTVSADVAITTHLAGWINRKGVYFPRARPDFFADAAQAMQWRESPAGQHIELGIAEHNLFLLLGALGLTDELSGMPLLPIGTLYDPFVARGLDALYHALYAGARFVVVATPSGITLSHEGGAHQSVVTPGVGVALPGIAYFEPTFAREVEWILLEALAGLAARRADAESLYLRLSTKPIDQSLAPAPGPEQRRRVLRGGYRLIDGRPLPGYDPATTAVHLFAVGAMVAEAIEASHRLRAHGACPSVFVVTSPDRLYRGLRDRGPYLEELVGADEEGIPIVSVLDGHSHGLAFLGGALGAQQLALGVDDFGQSGSRADLYRHFRIDATAIVDAASLLLGS